MKRQPNNNNNVETRKDIEEETGIILSMKDKEQIKSHISCAGKKKGASCDWCFHTEGLGDDCQCDDNPDQDHPVKKICRIKDDKKGKFQEKADNFCSVAGNNGKFCNYCDNDKQNKWKKDEKACVCSENVCKKNEQI